MDKSQNPSIASAGPNRKLATALYKVASTGFPVNQAVLKTLVSIPVEPEVSKQEITTILKSDPGLFFHVMEWLSSKHQKDKNFNQQTNLFALLEQESAEEIIDAVKTMVPSLVTFTSDSIEDTQKLLSRQIIISCTASEIFANEVCFDPEISYLHCLYNFTGILLLAWHYPVKLKQALIIKEGSSYSLDDAVTSVLGFSPGILTENFLILKKYPTQFINEVKNSAQTIIMNSEQPDEFLYKIIEFSNGLGRKMVEGLSVCGDSCWSDIKNELTNALGADGLKNLEVKVERQIQNYVINGLIPQSTELIHHHGLEAAENNTYLLNCTESIQESIKACYELIESKNFSVKAISYLTRTVLPKAFFKNGAFYLLNPQNELLEPKYQIGDRGLENFPRFDTKELEEEEHPVLSAYYSQFPVLMMETLSGEKGLSSISGQVNSPGFSGVLYLELDTELHHEHKVDSLQVFKAINNLAIYCLGTTELDG